jgi:hypothetical protein
MRGGKGGQLRLSPTPLRGETFFGISICAGNNWKGRESSAGLT